MAAHRHTRFRGYGTRSGSIVDSTFVSLSDGPRNCKDATGGEAAASYHSFSRKPPVT